MIQALLFDFDGLIFDSETPDYRSWHETFATFGCDLPLEVWGKSIGGVDLFNPYDYLEELLGQAVDRTAVHAQRQQRDHELLAEQSVMPGVHSYLAEARDLGLKVGVASSSDHAWVDAHLERLGLIGQFDVIICRDDVGNRGKPDPAVYLAAIGALDVTPQRALALEDSANGSIAAKRAGMFCVAVPNQMTHYMDFSHVDYRLSSLADMPLTTLITQVVNGSQK